MSTQRRSATAAPLLVVLLAAAALQPAARPGTTTHDCGLPDAKPLWIEYGAGTVPPEVRAVFRRPGVVVAASGTAIPANYRAAGAATVFFAVDLPRYVGEPAEPADPATVQAAADRLFDDAVASTACATPWIALNELLGSQTPAPWSANVAQYRANVLALVERLAARGARPALLVHGSPTVAGETAAWWQSVGRSAHVVYEAYYNAVNISRLGPVLGTRRLRLGMRSVIRLFASAGIPRERLGLMLGFQVAPGGNAGREGLQPREEWFRVVKWHALAARQVTLDEGTSTVWSWGWGTFGPASTDPDKPTAACVYLWTRDPALCDGPGAAGPAFNTSLDEGPINLPAGIHCTYEGGTIATAPVAELTRLTKDVFVSVTALFARALLAPRVVVTTAEIERAERQAINRAFRGSRKAYVAALAKRGATATVARGVIEDELRRWRLASGLARRKDAHTALTAASDLGTVAVDTAICLRDELPGSGDFPRSNSRETGAVPLPALLPFLFADRTPPQPPQGLAATPTPPTITLDWADSREADLVGYHVYRAAAPRGPYTQLTSTPLVRSTFVDGAAPVGATSYYVVRSLDTSRNASRLSAEVAAAI